MSKKLNVHDKLRIQFNNAVSNYNDLFADVLVQGREVEVRLFRGDKSGGQCSVAPTLTPAIADSVTRTLSQYGIVEDRIEIYIDRLCIPSPLPLINAI